MFGDYMIFRDYKCALLVFIFFEMLSLSIHPSSFVNLFFSLSFACEDSFKGFCIFFAVSFSLPVQPLLDTTDKSECILEK